MRGMPKRDSAYVFSAYYDRCHYSALFTALAGWSRPEVEALYQGASYFRFSPAAQRAYLRYENWLERRSDANCATYCLVSATR